VIHVDCPREKTFWVSKRELRNPDWVIGGITSFLPASAPNESAAQHGPPVKPGGDEALSNGQ
jgi:hypothetical protein